MHPRLVSKVLSPLTAIVSLSMLWPLAWALRDGGTDVRAFATAVAVGLGLSAALFLWGRGADYADLDVKDGFGVVALMWLAASLLGALPFWLHGVAPTFADAFFESVSGFTTTGASVIAEVEACPRGILFWRGLTHWLGGMGIIVLGLAVLPFLGVGGMDMFRAEVPGPSKEKMTPRIQETAIWLWGVYALLTILQTALLSLGGMSLFDALVHSFGTVATGGFSNLNRSVGQYGSAYFEWVIAVFMFLAGANFVLHYRFLRGDFSSHFRNEEFRVYAGIVLVSAVAISAELLRRGVCPSAAEAVRHGTFQVVSVITTTGFVTADFELWPSFSRMLLFFLMFAGGCAGSTGGGIKTIRLLVLWRHMRAGMQGLLHPRAVVHIKVGGKAVGEEIVSSVTAFFILYMTVFACGAFFMTLIGMDFITAVTGVASTLGNVGPALGALGPMENYSAVPQAGKWGFSALMLMGRLELYTVLLLFTPGTWRR